MQKPLKFRSLLFSFGSRAVFLLLGLVGALLYVLFADVKHSAAYQTILAAISSQSIATVTSPYQAKQERLQVRKDILLSQGQERRLARISAAEALLTYNHQESGSEMVEEMKDVVCILQKQLYLDAKGYPQQTVICLLATEASFFHRQGILIADNVEIEEMQLPGHAFPEPSDFKQPGMAVQASKLALSLEPGSQLNMIAFGLKGTLHSPFKGVR